ncbi:type IV pilus assembly protein PilC [Diaminobutyricimonas aerilata]|uniref:Type IV pilus assembly protein PilC n=1 Tax=Diaminobutyricimonas aerilata TaxID=1162967 RepID=A0A2M9CMY0_9MICO|nr:type II secretion system F family protein [Diaminobutyricimonas aerilata]PJJ73251.1 type IV pilus assembly protein PilC [Diaminobutyricimonas aerilata]
MTTATTFEYKGVDGSGKPIKGRIDAASEQAVAMRLRALGIAATGITPVNGGTGLQREITIPAFEKKVGLKDLAIMSRQAATMIAAGLALLQTLNILADQSENKKLKTVLGEVRTDVERGSSLSDAMAKHQLDFPPLMINMIRAGEVGGFLEKALESVAGNFEKEVKLRNTIKAALTYPVIVLIMSILAVIGMLIFIVPVFEKMFQDLGGELPLPTQFLVVMSKQMVWLAPLLAVLLVVGSVWWGRHKNDEKVRRVVDPWRLRVPVFGHLAKKIAIARFTRNFSTMIGSGVPILRSIAIVGETSGNFVIESALRKVQESVRHGQSIAKPLAQEPVFPQMVVQMIAVGEDSGALEQMLAKVSDFYDDEVQSTTEQLTALIEPLMIAFLGIVVGGMIVALYLPIFSIIGTVQ